MAERAVATRPDFFAHRPAGETGLALFLNAGDPPLTALPDVLHMLDGSGVDCLELAVPFPHSFTDGPVVRRSADRALSAGVGLADVLSCVAEVRPRLGHLRIALLTDWSHTVRPVGLDEFLRRVADSAVDALLLHGLPATQRAGYYRTAADLAVPIVTTCYPGSAPEVQAESAHNASAYLYLVSHYGRSGQSGGGLAELGDVLTALRRDTSAPIAVGFGVRERADVETLARIGADAAVVGSATVSTVESALTEGRDVTTELARFVSGLRQATNT
jgi:tryptophan synthase alpha chain